MTAREKRIAQFDTKLLNVSRNYTMFPWAKEMWDIVKSLKGTSKLDVREVATEEGAEISPEVALRIVRAFMARTTALVPRQRKWWIPSKVDPQHRGLIIERSGGGFFLGFFNKDF
jgi:hypothetical protein